MKILMISPSSPEDQRGNTVTSDRWIQVFEWLGHTVQRTGEYEDVDQDVTLGLHARHSSDALREARRQYPDRPIVLALTGTDLYRDIHEDESVRRTLQVADQLVVLQSEGPAELSQEEAQKTTVIHQSVPRVHRPREEKSSLFEVAVIGHLRPVKDPFRAALAVRDFPEDSQLQVLHLGRELEPGMKRRAIEETRDNHRYRWIGEQPRTRTLQILARSDVLVHSSRLEGGANVVSEAIATTTPVLASDIPGNRGLLGTDYRGLYTPEATSELRDLLRRSETDEDFYAELVDQVRSRQPLIDVERETRQWDQLLNRLTAHPAEKPIR